MGGGRGGKVALLGGEKGGGDENVRRLCVFDVTGGAGRAGGAGEKIVETHVSVTGSKIPMLPSPNPTQISGSASAVSDERNCMCSG